ncbi:histone-like nucleoid-structuring protein Lsr2 [Nocardia sp. SC052]|uniref:histone-like nucleoid-structuring protein Lsr2 n=1 Tax=Nocardia sichangensis TaxID=3385975 RepID=UPI00399FFE35
MARKVVVEMVDDYDSQSPADETVSFALDGVTYELDLSHPNAKTLRDTFEQWTRHARKVGRIRRDRSVLPRSATERIRTADIREWARKEGIEVSRRGRIASEVLEQYKQTNR